MPFLKTVFSNFKERKIGQTAVVYLGSAWVLTEAFSFFIQHFGWSVYFIDVVLVIALCGFPAALILRYYQQGTPSPQNNRKQVGLLSINFVFMLGCLYLFSQRSTLGSAKTPTDDLSIAILPFDNISKDPSHDYFGEGIMDDIISKLYKIASLKVTSRTSAMLYKQPNAKSIQQIATELGVAYLMEGSFLTNGKKVHVTARLIKAASGDNIWNEVYDTPINDIFSLQNELSEKIAQALKIKLTSDEKSLITKTPTLNSLAYQYYTQGRASLNKNRRENIQQAKKLFLKAIQEDSAFALAYVGLSETYLAQIDMGNLSPNEVSDSIISPLQSALKLDPNLGEAYSSLGTYHLYVTHNFTEAKTAFEKAIQLNPGNDLTYFHYSALCAAQNQKKLTMEYIEKAISLNPLSTRAIGYKMTFLIFFNEYETTVAEATKALELFPNDEFILWNKACAQIELQKYNDAVKTFLQRDVPTKATNWVLGIAYAKMGQKENARQIVDALVEKSKAKYVPQTYIGLILTAMNEPEKAIPYIEKGFQQKDNFVLYYKVSPWYKPLYSNPDFQVLLKKWDTSLIQ